MGRVRTPSPRRDRDRQRRSRSRERRGVVPREVREGGQRRHSRSPQRRRSRSPHGHRRSRSPADRRRSRSSSSESGHAMSSRPKVDAKDLVGLPPEEQEMMKMMGFAGFDSTKGKKVAGNDVGATNLVTKRKYRQYMNRRGGFNRPLDFIA